jgi:type IV secretion system protein VirB8
MNQENFALPIDRTGLSEYYKQVESFQRERAKAARQTSKVLAAVAGIAIVANLGQAWTIASLLPLTRIVPVYLWVRPDGTVDNSVALSRLPATQSQAVVTAALWEYVRLREGYSYDTAQYGYDAVSAMSADAPRAQYQGWFNYPNPQSPQVTVGKKGMIEIQHIASANIAADVQQIRYRRVLTLIGQQPIITTWTATLQFETVATLPAALRLRNPGGVIVTSYQAAEDSTE